MSFSSQVKSEIVEWQDANRHCRIAELCAIVNGCGVVTQGKNTLTLDLKTENAMVLQTYHHLVLQDFSNKDATVSTKDILLATGLMDMQTGNIEKKIDFLTIKSSCCKKAYLRGAFLCGGSVSDPQKAYHLEFVVFSEAYARRLMEMMAHFSLHPKYVERKGHCVVYLKEAEQIADVLNIIGAHVSLMAFENSRARKDIENDINRIANCELANTDKTLTAALSQIADIQLIEKTKGMETLSPQLLEIANIRLKNPEFTLQAIGQKLNPPMGKSGVYHRLLKLSKIADSLRQPQQTDSKHEGGFWFD